MKEKNSPPSPAPIPAPSVPQILSPLEEMDPPNEQKEAKSSRSFTPAEVNKIVSERLQAERKKQLATLQAQVEAAKKEATEQLRQSLLEEVCRREAEVALREHTAYAKERLASLDLPTSLLGMVDTRSTAQIDQSISGLENTFREAVRDSVSHRLGAASPVAWEPTTTHQRMKRALGI